MHIERVRTDIRLAMHVGGITRRCASESPDVWLDVVTEAEALVARWRRGS